MESSFSWVIAIAGLGWLGLMAGCVALLRRSRPLPAGTRLQEQPAAGSPVPEATRIPEAQPPIVFVAGEVDEDLETHFYCPDPTEQLDQATLEALMLAVGPEQVALAEPDATTQPSEYPSEVPDPAAPVDRVEASINPRALLDGGGPVTAFSRRRALISAASTVPNVSTRANIH